jgi:agmatinase
VDVHGIENVCSIGCRAIGREELERDDVVPFVSSFEVFDKGIEWAVKKMLDGLKADKVYLSIDIDGIDPAYAPGTGTPEPFGLLPIDVKKAIGLVGESCILAHLVEIGLGGSAMAAGIIRFVAFDAGGLILMLVAFIVLAAHKPPRFE